MRVAVFMGGPSREHAVSMKSGEAVCAALPPDKYDITKVTISLLGVWNINNGENLSASQALQQLKQDGIAVVFLALHGSFGEDGTIQALLEQFQLTYTGSGVAASLLAMDKVVSEDLFSSHGLRVPKSSTFTRYELVKEATLLERLHELRYPIVVKPASQGSSVGVTLVDSKTDLLPAIDFALENDNQIIVQEYIKGREVSCGVLVRKGKSEGWALPPTELKPVSADFFDYYAKYTPGATDEITPPDMPAKLIQQIQDTALTAHELLGCVGYSRTDMIIRDNTIYVIETNTLPGMTGTSILPQQAAAAGLSFPELTELIIDNALTQQ